MERDWVFQYLHHEHNFIWRVYAEVHSEPNQTSMMELFVKIISESYKRISYKKLRKLRNSSSHQRCSIKIGILKNFAKFARKHLCQSLFFNKVVTFFTEYLRWLLLWRATEAHSSIHDEAFCENSDRVKDTNG